MECLLMKANSEVIRLLKKNHRRWEEKNTLVMEREDLNYYKRIISWKPREFW